MSRPAQTHCPDFGRHAAREPSVHREALGQAVEEGAVIARENPPTRHLGKHVDVSLRPRWSSALKVALASHIALNQPDLAASTLRELEHQNDTCGDMLNSFAKLHQPGPSICLGHPAGSCRCSERHAWRPGWPSIG